MNLPRRPSVRRRIPKRKKDDRPYVRTTNLTVMVHLFSEWDPVFSYLVFVGVTDYRKYLRNSVGTSTDGGLEKNVLSLSLLVQVRG